MPPWLQILRLGPVRALQIAGGTQIRESAKIDLPNWPDSAKIDWSRVDNVIVAELAQLIPRQDPPPLISLDASLVDGESLVDASLVMVGTDRWCKPG